MAGSGVDSANRSDGGTQAWGVQRIEHPRQPGDLRIGKSNIVRAPTQFIKIAHRITGSGALNRNYPYVGSDGLLDAVDDTSPTFSVDLDPTIPSGEDYTGCIFCPTGGVALGKFRYGIGWDTTGGVRRLILDRGWAADGETAPSVNDPYDIFVPALLNGKLLMRGEVNASNVGDTVTGIVRYYTYPRSLASPFAGIAPEPYQENSIITLSNMGLADGVREGSGYFHLGLYSRPEVDGAWGIKFRVTAFGVNANLHSLLLCCV